MGFVFEFDYSNTSVIEIMQKFEFISLETIIQKMIENKFTPEKSVKSIAFAIKQNAIPLFDLKKYDPFFDFIPPPNIGPHIIKPALKFISENNALPKPTEEGLSMLLKNIGFKRDEIEKIFNLSFLPEAEQNIIDEHTEAIIAKQIEEQQKSDEIFKNENDYWQVVSVLGEVLNTVVVQKKTIRTQDELFNFIMENRENEKDGLQERTIKGIFAIARKTLKENRNVTKKNNGLLA